MTAKSPAPRKAKKRKLDISKDNEEIIKSWQRVGIVLDTLIGGVSPQDSYKLLPSLFGLLERYGSVWLIM